MLNDFKNILRAHLSSNENLLWAGQPRAGIVLRATDAFLIPFSLMWGGFAISWELTALTKHAPFFFKLWGIPFVFIGLYFIFGRFIADAKLRSNTYYGVTNERIIILSGLFSRKVKSLNLKTLTDVSLDEKLGGSGTITFGAINPMSWWYSGMAFPGWGPSPTPAFELIQNAKSVYETIRNAQREAT